MKNEFVPYDIAVELQNLGFNEPCICGYDREERLRGKLAHSNDKGARIDWDKHDDHLPAPLWQQVFRWFVEKHQLNGFPYYSIAGGWDYTIQRVEAGILTGQSTDYIAIRDTYPESQEACIKRLIEKVKERKNENKNSH